MPPQNLTRASLLLLGFGLAVFGPLMAAAPRFMPGAAIYAALVMLPLLLHQGEALKNFLNRRALWLVIAAVAYSCVTAFWTPAPHPARAAIDLAYLSLCAVLMAAEIQFIPNEMREKLILIFSLSLLVGFCIMAEEFITDHFLHRFFNNVPEGDFVGENVNKRMVALFSLVIWPAAAWLEQRKNRTYALGALVGILGFSLIATNRSAALGMVVGFAVWLLAYASPKLMRYALMATLVVGLVAAVPVLSYADHAPETLKDKLFGSAKYRLKIWQYTAHHVPKSPIIGHGLDSSRGLVTNVGVDGLPFMKPGPSIIAQHPHNVFLQIWLDLGAIGAVLWGTLLVMLAHGIRKLPLKIQPYALGAGFCSVALLATTYSILQAWWGAAHIVAALMILVVAQSLSSKADTSGASAGGMG